MWYASTREWFKNSPLGWIVNHLSWIYKSFMVLSNCITSYIPFCDKQPVSTALTWLTPEVSRVWIFLLLLCFCFKSFDSTSRCDSWFKKIDRLQFLLHSCFVFEKINVASNCFAGHSGCGSYFAQKNLTAGLLLLLFKMTNSFLSWLLYSGSCSPLVHNVQFCFGSYANFSNKLINWGLSD